MGRKKSLIVPSWATEANLIGYTSSHTFSGSVSLQSLIKMADGPGGLESLPSVYYKKGHATLDHGVGGNVGWEVCSNMECLYFGNVPKLTYRLLRPAVRSGKLAEHIDQLVTRYGSYYRNGLWRDAVKSGSGRTLLEIWQESEGVYDVHPSRNRFVWVTDSSARRGLHRLATGWKPRDGQASGRKVGAMAVMRKGAEAQQSRNRH